MMAAKGQQPCIPETSILENELEFLAQENLVERLKVVETPNGYYLRVLARPIGRNHVRSSASSDKAETVAKLLRSPDIEWYVTTRRVRRQPRLFKNLDRLNARLLEVCPCVNYEVIRSPIMAKLRASDR